LEGGLKVPFILHWSGKVPSQKYKKMVSSMDIFQTVAENTGITLPSDRVYDGVNLIPYLNGQNQADPHEYLYWQRGFSKAIRSKNRKLFINEDAQDTVLFDMDIDPFENNNTASEEPEIVNQLAQIHKAWSVTLPPPLWPGMIYYEFKDGDRTYYFDQ
jgi:arylsulfatase A-like enzyme